MHYKDLYDGLRIDNESDHGSNPWTATQHHPSLIPQSKDSGYESGTRDSESSYTAASTEGRMSEDLSTTEMLNRLKARQEPQFRKHCDSPGSSRSSHTTFSAYLDNQSRLSMPPPGDLPERIYLVDLNTDQKIYWQWSSTSREWCKSCENPTDSWSNPNWPCDGLVIIDAANESNSWMWSSSHHCWDVFNVIYKPCNVLLELQNALLELQMEHSQQYSTYGHRGRVYGRSQH
jgi:hypothetical protein